MLYYTGEADLVHKVITEEHWENFALNDFVLASADRAGARKDLIDMYIVRIEKEPTNAQHRESLVFLYYMEGNITTSIEILEMAIAEIPVFETAGNCYIGNLKEGRHPDEGCSGEIPAQNAPVQNAPVRN